MKDLQPVRVAIAVTLVVLLAGGGALINLRLIDAHNANLDPVAVARFTTDAPGGAPSRLDSPAPPAPPAPADAADDADDAAGPASPNPAAGPTDAPTTAAVPIPAPGVTTRTPNPAPSAVVTSHSLGAAGTLILAVQDGTVTVISVQMTEGWTYETKKQTPDEVELDFQRADTELSFRARLENGRLRVEIDEDDD
ncbi:MAG: hypothetical protein EXQ71_12440 [Acidimicrobiia bacterium]|nr:hypothetical protein [Acidimicrobiia bacterium]